MWDLTVDGAHSFFVGAAGVLVHNSCKDPVQQYEVGQYNELTSRSGGTGLEIHHAPQGHPAGQAFPGYDYSKAPSIALSHEEHAAIPNLKGPFAGTPQELLDLTVDNLRTFTNAPESAIQQLVQSWPW